MPRSVQYVQHNGNLYFVNNIDSNLKLRRTTQHRILHACSRFHTLCNHMASHGFIVVTVQTAVAVLASKVAGTEPSAAPNFSRYMRSAAAAVARRIVGRRVCTALLSAIALQPKTSSVQC